MTLQSQSTPLPSPSTSTRPQTRPLWRFFAMTLFLGAATISDSLRSARAFNPLPATSPSRSRTLPRLHYASSSAADPLSKADSSKKGGCPFLSNTISATFSYSVPALFHDGDSRPIVLFDNNDIDIDNDIDNGDHRELHDNKLITTLLKYDSRRDDPRGNLRFAPFQSKVGKLLLDRLGKNDNNNNENYQMSKSIVICTPSKTYVDSSALFYLIQSLGGIRWKLVNYLAFLGYLVPTNVRDRWYANFLERRLKRTQKRKQKQKQKQKQKRHNQPRDMSDTTSDSATSASSLMESKGRKRRRNWRKERNDEQRQLLWMDRINDRLVSDSILTGAVTSHLFDSDASHRPPTRGDRVKVVWPIECNSRNKDGTNGIVGKAKEPTITYDEQEYPNGICLIGATGTISTIDLPMRVVLRVDRTSIGLENKTKTTKAMVTKEKGDEVEEPVEEIEDTVIAWVKPEEIVMA